MRDPANGTKKPRFWSLEIGAGPSPFLYLSRRSMGPESRLEDTKRGSQEDYISRRVRSRLVSSRNNIHPRRPCLSSLHDPPSSTSTDGTATWLHRPSHHDGYLLLRRAYLQVGRIFAWLLAPTSLPDDNLETAATASDQHASKKKTIFVLLSPSELNARHFPSGHNVADQSTLLGPIIADAHSMTILRRGASKSGCAARLLNALNAFFQASGGKCSSLTQLVVAIPSSGARSAELVMGSRGLYRHHYYRLRGKAYCALGISSPSGRRTPDECRPASSLAAVNPASPAEWSTLHDFLFFLLSDGEGIGAPHSAGFLGTEA